MPQLDGTGPTGQGSRTGKRQGRCSALQNDNVQTVTNARRGFRFRFMSEEENEFGRGRGQGKGRGRRMGRNNNFNQ